MKNTHNIFTLSLILMTLLSCKQVIKEVVHWNEVENINTIEGKTHYLTDDGIKIYLPTTFKKYTSIEYLTLLDALVTDNKELNMERTRLRYMREMTGNHYIFFDNTVYATCTINTVPYLPITRQDAKYILGILRSEQRKVSEQSNLNYTKITAKHNSNGKTQIFKAIFKIENTKAGQQIFQHAYYISSNHKTILINLTAPFLANFDPFIEKIIL